MLLVCIYTETVRLFLCLKYIKITTSILCSCPDILKAVDSINFDIIKKRIVVLSSILYNLSQNLVDLLTVYPFYVPLAITTTTINNNLKCISYTHGNYGWYNILYSKNYCLGWKGKRVFFSNKIILSLIQMNNNYRSGKYDLLSWIL